MKIMKIRSLIFKRAIWGLLIVSSVLLTTGCEKEKTELTKTTSVKGLWEGTMTDAITQPVFISIKSDGTCTSENISPWTQENLSYGTWSLDGTTITCNLLCTYGYVTNVGLQMTFTGTFDSREERISGTFHLAAPSGDTQDGTFSLVKTY